MPGPVADLALAALCGVLGLAAIGHLLRHLERREG